MDKDKLNSKSKISFSSGQEEQRFIIDKRFKIIRCIGKGGMGEIFLAEDLKLRRFVAIKSIKGESVGDSESKMRFLREAQTASQLEHTNICPIYEIYEEEDEHYIVMQYIDGVTLDTIRKFKQIGIKKIIDIGIQICNGMIEAHSKGIIHRDLKPGNIIIDKKGGVKILDFGLAKFSDRTTSDKTGIVNSNLTEKGIIMGTVAYMSPEQARGEILDNRSDIFSFGILMYELIEEENPFYDKEQINTLYNVLNKEVKFSSKIPTELKDILTKLLKKKKNERFKDFAEVRDEMIKYSDSYRDEKQHEENDKTEIIDLGEKMEIMEKIKKTSDVENLGELVYRIKKIKAKTLPMVSTKKFYLKKISILFSVILILFSVFLLIKEKGNISFSDKNGVFFINVKNFEGDVPQIVKDSTNLLVRESLNQFEEFDTISPKILESIENSFVEPESGINIRERNRIFYDIDGQLTKIKNIYNFDIILSSIKKKKSYSITIPGLENEDSILKHQIDTIAKRIYEKIFPGKNGFLKIKPISNIYGSDWADYINFYKGLKQFNKFNNLNAKYFFSRGVETIADKFYIANILHFRGKGSEAEDKIKEILPYINTISNPFKLKILALNARLKFKLSDEISFLKKLKERNTLSKESFFDLGEAFFYHGNAKKASEYYLKAIAIDNKFSSAINHLGYCYSYMGDHRKAIELFEEYRRIDNSANSFDSLGDGYFFSGELISAEASKRAAINKDAKGVYWAYLTLSDISLLKSRLEETIKLLDEYLTIAVSKKDRSIALAKKAYVAYIKNNYNEALKKVDKSLGLFDFNDINNNSSEQRWIKGLILLGMKKKEECRKEVNWLRKMVKDNKLSKDNFSKPYKYYLHLNALYNEHNNMIDEAEKNFRELLKMKSQLSYWITMFNYQYFHTEYAKFLMRNKRFGDSEKEIDKCLKYSPIYLPALWIKAELVKRKGKDDALIYFNKIDNLYGENKEKNFITEKLYNELKVK